MARRPAAILVALIGAALLAPPALGAPAPASPLTQLLQVRRDLGSLTVAARTPAARRLVGEANRELAGATVTSLWIDPHHLVAPPYGSSVFNGTRDALHDLARVPASAAPTGRIAAAEAAILAADRSLALAAIRQAARGTGGLLARARGMILSGDRWAQTSRVDLGAVQYGTAWRDAFQALTDLVVARAAFVSPAVLGRTAQAASRNRAIVPAGIHALSPRGPLRRSGKPEVLFVGLESCRFCAVERWGLVVALSRFGTFSNLRLGQSTTTAPPVVRSFTFAGARYRSPYIAFESVELFGNRPRRGGGFQPFQHLTPAERTLLRRLDPATTSPFVDVANHFADVGATVPPRLLGVSSWAALGSSIRHARSEPGQAIAATAEVLTSEICQTTGGDPAPVCASNVVQDYSRRLVDFGGRGGGCPVTPLRWTATRPSAPRRLVAWTASRRGGPPGRSPGDAPPRFIPRPP